MRNTALKEGKREYELMDPVPYLFHMTLQYYSLLFIDVSLHPFITQNLVEILNGEKDANPVTKMNTISPIVDMDILC